VWYQLVDTSVCDKMALASWQRMPLSLFRVSENT